MHKTPESAHMFCYIIMETVRHILLFYGPLHQLCASPVELKCSLSLLKCSFSDINDDTMSTQLIKQPGKRNCICILYEFKFELDVNE